MEIRNLDETAVAVVAVLLDDEPRSAGEVARGVFCRTGVRLSLVRVRGLLEVLEHRGLVERAGGRRDGQGGWRVASRVTGVSEAERTVSVDMADDREAFGEALAAVVEVLDLVQYEAHAAYVPGGGAPTAVRYGAVRGAARILLDRRSTVLALLDYARLLAR